MHLARRIFQTVFLILVIVTGFRYAMGWSQTTIESYCPFGGLEVMASLVTQRQFTCATGERNLTLFLALIALTLLARKSFCSWVCPIGFISEGFRKLSGRRSAHKITAFQVKEKSGADRIFKFVRAGVLLLILYFTFRTGELIFRGYDPYYILFSFHGHDVQFWSYGILALIFAGIAIVPMLWCKYLCPLGAALWPVSLLGRLRVHRNPKACTRCGACDRACPMSLPVSNCDQVRSGDCTLCTECLSVCKQKDALELRMELLKK